MRRLVACLILFMFSTLSIASIGVNVVGYELPENKKFIILIDEGHNQIFSAKDFLEGFYLVNETLPIEVYELHEPIDSKVLSGVDLLIIPPKSSGSTYKTDEVEAISKFIERGGSLLVLGTTNTSADMGLLNLLLEQIEINDEPIGDYIQFLLVKGSPIKLYDDLSNPSKIESLLSINVSMWSGEASNVFSEVNGTILIESAALNVLEYNDFIILNASETSYGLDQDGELYFANSTPAIGALKTYGEFSRVAVLGFTEPLTNRTSPLGDKWINLGANKEFFKSLITWLLRPQAFKVENIQRPTELYLYLIALAIILLPIAYVVNLYERKIEKKKEKKKEEIRVSEILAKIREEGKKKNKK